MPSVLEERCAWRRGDIGSGLDGDPDVPTGC